MLSFKMNEQIKIIAKCIENFTKKITDSDTSKSKVYNIFYISLLEPYYLRVSGKDI